MAEYNGLGLGMGTLSRLSRARSRSISAENFTGDKGKAGMAETGTGERCARELGRGWKVSPSVHIEPGATFEIASTSWLRLFNERPARIDCPAM